MEEDDDTIPSLPPLPLSTSAMTMNKIQLHFTWENDIDAEPYLALVDVDLLRADDSLSDKGKQIQTYLLSLIDGDVDFVDSIVLNRIYEAEDDFDLEKYTVAHDIRCITIESWKQP